MPAVLENIAIGLITSVVSGICVWLWQRVKTSRRIRRKATFFGIAEGSECLVVINHYPGLRWMMRHEDIYALVEVVMLVRDLGAQALIAPWDEVREGVGNRTEFCIGGPGANSRTAGLLASYLPGVTMRPYNAAGGDSLAFVTGEGKDKKTYMRTPGQLEFAVVAKFTRREAPHPVFVICGQTAIANWAAVHFLCDRYSRLEVESTNQFCLLLTLRDPKLYGHHEVDHEDISSVAFTVPRQPSQSSSGP